jgi:broad specificity polyphosphatase/5'/3'-nucleotidase SurE
MEWEAEESQEPEEGTDIWALFNDRASITPLHSDLTSPTALSTLEQLSNSILQDLGNPPD